MSVRKGRDGVSNIRQIIRAREDLHQAVDYKAFLESLLKEVDGAFLVPVEKWQRIKTLIEKLQNCDECALLCDWNGCPNKIFISELKEEMGG